VRRLVTPASVPLSGFDPLSGFAASQSFAAVFHAATVPGIPPFRVFPSQEIAYPSRGSLAPLQLSTGVLGRTARAFRRRFLRLPTSSRQLSGSPADYGFPFRAPKRAFRSPWVSCLRNRPVPPASPASKLHSLLRVRSQLPRVSPHQPADTLLGFCPSRAFSFHASDSRPAQARKPEHVPFVRRARARDSKDRSPSCRVRRFLHHE